MSKNTGVQAAGRVEELQYRGEYVRVLVNVQGTQMAFNVPTCDGDHRAWRIGDKVDVLIRFQDKQD